MFAESPVLLVINCDKWESLSLSLFLSAQLLVVLSTNSRTWIVVAPPELPQVFCLIIWWLVVKLIDEWYQNRIICTLYLTWMKDNFMFFQKWNRKVSLKGIWQLQSFSNLFKIPDVSGGFRKRSLDGSVRVKDGVCGSKPTQFQFQRISPNYILWSLVRDYFSLILTNAAEWHTSLTTEQQLHRLRWPRWSGWINAGCRMFYVKRVQNEAHSPLKISTSNNNTNQCSHT